MLIARRNSPGSGRVGLGLATLVLALAITNSAAGAASADDTGFVRSALNDDKRVTVEATKPGTTGAKPATSSTSSKAGSAAKPITAGTTTKLDLSDLVIAHNKQIIIPECWDGTLSTNGCQPTNNPTTPAAPRTSCAHSRRRRSHRPHPHLTTPTPGSQPANRARPPPQ